jgi:hypothetical protein
MILVGGEERHSGRHVMTEDKLRIISKVHDDALSPSARAVGQSLCGVVKAALRPVDGLAWTMNQCFDWVQNRITAHFERQGTLPENVVAPPPETLVRVLFGLQIAGPSNDPLPRNMFAELLATAMTKGTDRKAHPAFAETLRQLVPDEARLMAVISSRPLCAVHVRVQACYLRRPVVYTIVTDEEFRRRDPIEKIDRDWMPLQSWALLPNPKDIDFYLVNLERVGLIEKIHRHEAGELTVDDSADIHVEALWPLQLDDEGIVRSECEDRLRQLLTSCPKDKYVHKDILVEAVTFTHWGREFGLACGAEEFFDRETKKFSFQDEDNANSSLQPKPEAGHA